MPPWTLTRGIAPLTLALATLGLPALADVLPPEGASALMRLRDNPQAFDRTDEYCLDKKVGHACSIPGDTFAGGGAGSCKNAFNRSAMRIDLSCVRDLQVRIDRQLPESDFILSDATLCEDFAQMKKNGVAGPEELSCTPPPTPPVDRFCAGKAVGASCRALLTVDGAQQDFPGICREVEQTRSVYLQGRRKAVRTVILCQPPEPLPPRSYAPVSWWSRLLQ